jgi:hypothetical protein
MQTTVTPAFAPAVGASPADWVLANLRGFAEGVGSIVPDWFASYARVFHRAARRVEDAETGPLPGAEIVESVSWAEVASANRRHTRVPNGARSQARCGTSTTTSSRGFGTTPQSSEARPRKSPFGWRLVLARFTNTPRDCWFGVSDIWDGRSTRISYRLRSSGPRTEAGSCFRAGAIRRRLALSRSA